MSGRRIAVGDVRQTYKNSFRTKVDFDNVLPANTNPWLTMYEAATNCARSLILASLIGLTGVVCGPTVKISSNENTFISCLNQYVIAVCAPGREKSNTFERIISPVMEEIDRINSKRSLWNPILMLGYKIM